MELFHQLCEIFLKVLHKWSISFITFFIQNFDQQIIDLWQSWNGIYLEKGIDCFEVDGVLPRIDKVSITYLHQFLR